MEWIFAILEAVLHLFSFLLMLVAAGGVILSFIVVAAWMFKPGYLDTSERDKNLQKKMDERD